MHKWLKGLKCQNYMQVGKRFKMSTLYTMVKRLKCQHYTQWLKMSTLYTSGKKG